ncbi:MAG: hypothetical protein ISR86_06645 [Nitrospinaceae bacterium]|nr:hypothetical protein [Candidatus Brocadiales bacterium]MBL7020206.1 hypothetical protein [Nitrospinaceae bacterium]
MITTAREGNFNGTRSIDINGLGIHSGSNPTLVLGGVTLSVLAIDPSGTQVIAILPSAFNGGTHLLELSHSGGDSQFDFTIVTVDAKAPFLECYQTGWGPKTGCTDWPQASPPGCASGYIFAGIAAETHSDRECYQSAHNKQQLRSTCCRLGFR